MSKVRNLKWEIPRLGIHGSIFDWAGIIEKDKSQMIAGNIKAQAVCTALEQNNLVRFSEVEVEIPEEEIKGE